MKYYRVAIRLDAEHTWRWRSTVLNTLFTVFEFLRLYQPLTQDRMRVFTASSRENLDVQLAHENLGVESDSLTAAQFLRPRLSSLREMPQAHSHQQVTSGTTAAPPILMVLAQMYAGCVQWQEKKWEEPDAGIGGDHDLSYTFDGPSSTQQALAWTRLLVGVQEGTLQP